MSFAVDPGVVVLDASAAVRVLTDPDTALHGRWAEWVEEGRQLLVPAHFWAEVGNALLRGVGLAPIEVTRQIEALVSAGVEVADRGRSRLVEGVELAERHTLSVYDALYLQLALELEAELATHDAALARAAAATGVALAFAGSR